jgi:probable HAF family extracellular repeat protein
VPPLKCFLFYTLTTVGTISGGYSLGTLGGISSTAFGINDSGKIVGHSDIGSSIDHAFLFDGTMTDIGTPPGASSWVNARDINNSDQIVGYYSNSTGYEQAYLYDGGTWINLPSLGGNSSNALEINDSGQIIGWAKTSSGEQHAVLWNPVAVVPEPVSSILFLIGGATLGLRGYARRKRQVV